MRDCTGVEIKQGDTVAIARRSGSSCWIDTAKVVEVILPENKYVVTEIESGEAVTSTLPGIPPVDVAAISKVKLKGQHRPYIYSSTRDAIMVIRAEFV